MDSDLTRSSPRGLVGAVPESSSLTLARKLADARAARLGSTEALVAQGLLDLISPAWLEAQDTRVVG